MRSIKVKGVGYKKLPVDTIVVSINIEIVDNDYQVVIKKEQETFRELKELFGEQLKTKSYRVYPLTEHKDSRVVHIGYKTEHHLSLTFKFDVVYLGEVLTQIQKVVNQPTFSIQYSALGVDTDELRRLAVQDAFHQAQVLSDAAGVSLQRILAIYEPHEGMQVARFAKMDSAMSFDDIEQTYEIMIEWEIE